MIPDSFKATSSGFPSRLELINGVPCAILEIPGAPTFSILAGFRDGVAYEKEDEWGISHFIEHILFRGNCEYPSLYRISHGAESLGGRISAFSTRDGAFFWVKSPPNLEEQTTGLLGNLLTTPTLEEKFIEKERQIIVQERHREINNPSLFTSLLLEESVLSPSPICRHPIGSDKVIRSLDGKTLAEHLKRVYNRNNLIICAAGSASEEIKQHLECFTTHFPDGEQPLPARFDVSPDHSSHRHFIRESPHKKQVFLSLGWPINVKDYKELYAWRVLNSLLGAGYTSIFNRVLREEENLTYLCTTGLNLYGSRGVFKINLALSDKNLKRAIQLINEIISNVAQGKITDEEVNLAKIKHASHLLFKMEDPLEAARILSQRLLRDGTLFRLDGYIDSISAVDVVRISNLCKKQILPENCRVVMQTGSIEASKLFPDSVSI